MGHFKWVIGGKEWVFCELHLFLYNLHFHIFQIPLLLAGDKLSEWLKYRGLLFL
jgi:hypothetical protein